MTKKSSKLIVYCELRQNSREHDFVCLTPCQTTNQPIIWTASEYANPQFPVRFPLYKTQNPVFGPVPVFESRFQYSPVPGMKMFLSTQKVSFGNTGKTYTTISPKRFT